MKYLVDADVLSESSKPRPNASILAWLSEHEPSLLVNPIVLGELEFGILRLPEGKKRERLMEWFRRGLKVLNIVEIDAETASRWAQLLAGLRRRRTPMPIKDSLIAASALQHNLTIVTRNEKDFVPAGAKLLNPEH